MATFKNISNNALAIGDIILLPGDTITEAGSITTMTAQHIETFYNSGALECTAGTPSFTQALMYQCGVVQDSEDVLSADSAILPVNVFAVATDTGILKIGNGTDAWSGLSAVGGYMVKDVTTQQDITSNATLQNIAGLTCAGLVHNKRYAFEVILFVTNTSNNGIKVSFGTTDTLTLTHIIATADSYSSIGAIVAHTEVTGFSDSMCAATAAVKRVKIEGTFTVNIAGTLTVQAAQNVSHVDTLSILVGSHMRLWTVPT